MRQIMRHLDRDIQIYFPLINISSAKARISQAIIDFIKQSARVSSARANWLFIRRLGGKNCDFWDTNFSRV